MASIDKTSSREPPQPRALVVQDPHHGRLAARAVLQDLGFCVREAGRGVEAVSLVQSWHPQIILLDAQLRDASGLEVEGWLRAQPMLRDVPIVLMGHSAATGRPLDRNSRTIPLDQPLSSARLKQSIAAVLNRRGGPGDRR